MFNSKPHHRILNAIFTNNKKYITIVGACQAGKTDFTIGVITDIIQNYTKLGYIPDKSIHIDNYNKQSNKKIHVFVRFCISNNESVVELRKKFVNYNNNTTYIYDTNGEPIVPYTKLAQQIHHFNSKTAKKSIENKPDDIYIVFTDEDHLTKAKDSKFAKFQEELGFDVSKPCDQWKSKNVILLSVSATDIEAYRSNVSEFVFLRLGKEYRFKHPTIPINDFIVNGKFTPEFKNVILKWIEDRKHIGGTIVIRIHDKEFKKDFSTQIDLLLKEIKNKLNITVHSEDFHNKRDNLDSLTSFVENYNRGIFKLCTIYNSATASNSIKPTGPILWCCPRETGTAVVQSCGRMNGYPPDDGGWNEINGDRTLVVSNEGKKALDNFNEWLEKQIDNYDEGNEFLNEFPNMSSTYMDLYEKTVLEHDIFDFDKELSYNECNQEFGTKFTSAPQKHKVSSNKEYDLIDQINSKTFKSQYTTEEHGFKIIHVDSVKSPQGTELLDKTLNNKFIYCVPKKNKQIATKITKENLKVI